AHVGLGCGFDDTVFQATNGFQAQRYHHEVDDVLVGHFTLFNHDGLEQLVSSRVGDLLRLAALVGLVGVEAFAILLTQAIGLVHHVDSGLTFYGHTIREAFSHHVTTMVAGVDADHVGQVGRAHGPTELLHDLVDAHEVDTEAQQLGEAAEVREQHAVNQEARAVVDHDRVLAHLLGIGHGGGNGHVAGLLATNDLNQRHHVHRVEEVHADEVFRTLEGLGQQVDRDGRGVGSQDGIFLHHAFHLGQHDLLDLGVLDHGLDHDVDIAEITVGHGRANGVERLGHLGRSHAALLDALAEQLGGLVQTHLDTLFADILHQDRSALGGGLVGDATTHDAGA